MLKIILSVVIVLSAVVSVGYLDYLDTQKKKQQEVLKIIQDANRTMQTVKSNPYNQSLITQNNDY